MANGTMQKQKFSVAISQPSYQRLINSTLRDPKKANRFVSAITSAVAVNPQLQECTAPTILSGALLGESLGLSPSPQLGQYYLVPFKSKAKYDRQGNLLESECTKATFVLGYKGYIQLAIRSGYYRDIDARPIRQGEYLGRDTKTGKPLFQFLEDEEAAEQLPVVGYMAYFEYLNGFQKTLYWSKEKMMAHADQFSSAFSAEAYKKIQNGEISDKDMWKYSSFWYKDFDSMSLKTMLRQLISRWGIMSIEMQTAFENEDKVMNVDTDGIFTADVPEAVENTNDEPIDSGAVNDDDNFPVVVQASLDDFND